MYSWKKQRSGGVLLKLDFVKTYDMLEWSFIVDVLKARGFGNRWIGWMKLILFEGKSQIVVNGNVSNLLVSKT